MPVPADWKVPKLRTCECGKTKMVSDSGMRLIYRGKPYICPECADKQYEGRESISIYF